MKNTTYKNMLEDLISLVERQPTDDEADSVINFIVDIRVTCAAYVQGAKGKHWSCALCPDVDKCDADEEVIRRAFGIDKD